MLVVFLRNNTSDALVSTHRITGNTANTITFTPSTTISSGICNNYSYGAPCPAPAVGSTEMSCC